MRVLYIYLQIEYTIHKDPMLGGGFKPFWSLPLFGEMIQFDGCIFFQMGWFNHQLDNIDWTSKRRRFVFFGLEEDSKVLFLDPPEIVS